MKRELAGIRERIESATMRLTHLARGLDDPRTAGTIEAVIEMELDEAKLAVEYLESIA